MNLRHLPFFLFALPTAAGCTQPRHMYQEASIRYVGATPCFMVADTKESRATPPALVSMSVDRLEGNDWENVWQWIAPATPMVHAKPGECAPVGTTGPSGAGAQPQLRPGEKYHLVINAQVPNLKSRGDANLGRVYSKEFCLKEGAQGQFEVVDVPRVSGESQWQVCFR